MDENDESNSYLEGWSFAASELRTPAQARDVVTYFESRPVEDEWDRGVLDAAREATKE
jgi:hypothetical protein